MKQFFYFFVAILAMILITTSSCEKGHDIKDEVKQQGLIAFNLDLESSQLKSASSTDFSNLSRAIVTIKTADGDTTEYDYSKIKLFRIGTALFTEDIKLSVDDYVLTQFFLQDTQGNTLYACPQAGSAQSQNVNTPLPIDFSVVKNETVPVAVEVLATENLSPGDFGFSYFDVDFVGTFSLMINAVDSKQFSPLDANVSISSEASYHYTTQLKNILINRIKVKDNLKNYSITVSKEGYSSKSKSFTLNELKKYSTSPLSFVLEPSTLSLDSSIVICYPFNFDATDIGSYGYDLNNYGAVLCEDRLGNDSSAYNFTGNEGLTLLNNTIINQSLSQSISVWFKTSSLNKVEFGGVLFGILGSKTPGEASRFFICLKDGQIRGVYGDSYSATNGYWHDELISKNTYNDNEWHFVVFVSDSDSKHLSLYVDGVLVKSQTTESSNNNQTSALDIKVGGDKRQNYFVGCIDEPTLYSKALTSEEVLQLFEKGWMY